MDKTILGDRMKSYEKQYTSQQILAGFPICVRIDGRCFSKFTKGLNRPYDESFSYCMQETTKYLVEQSHAVVGYTQSDEISLIYHTDDHNSSVFFDGKVQKMVSVLASMATGKFISELLNSGISNRKTIPAFDSRVWMVPSKQEVINYLIWRNRDCVKNSISMAASHYYSHKELHGKTQTERLDMLHEIGVNWNDYPRYFKDGSFYKKFPVWEELTKEQLEKIPSKHRPDNNFVLRSEIFQCNIVHPFEAIKNKVAYIFDGKSPRYLEDDVSDTCASIIKYKP